ncbi:MAG TPA: heme-copper oxidase subunit III [Anaerolineales bacterium]|nr:heme-copper oxidase subunit III [Anaerolineales bacterium]
MHDATHPAEQTAMFKAGDRLGLDHLKLGMWLFLASEVMFFGGLISAFLHFKINNPSPESSLLDVVLVGINTFVLLASSLTVVLGLAAIQRGDRRGLMGYLVATIILGFAFLFGQGNEFVTLYRHGVTLSSSLFGSSFFTLTGFHGLHVFVGICWALMTLAKAARGGYAQEAHLGVEIFGLYWHFVDIVWIILFTLIYLV